MDNVHFHCSICDAGDYDLCETCVEGGKLCPGEGHWLVKRYVKDGKVISSTTERLAPKPKNSATIRKSVVVQREVGTEMPGAFTDDTKTLSEGTLAPTRTCNNCVSGKSCSRSLSFFTNRFAEKPDSEFVTCTSCDDYDLCLPCHSDNKHGHHPAHAFAPATSATSLSLVEKSLLAAGRNVRHHALCDGCDKVCLIMSLSYSSNADCNRPSMASATNASTAQTLTTAASVSSNHASLTLSIALLLSTSPSQCTRGPPFATLASTVMAQSAVPRLT